MEEVLSKSDIVDFVVDAVHRVSAQQSDLHIKSDTDLLSDGILNSFGMLRVVALLETEYHMRIPAKYITRSNFETARSIADVVSEIKGLT